MLLPSFFVFCVLVLASVYVRAFVRSFDPLARVVRRSLVRLAGWVGWPLGFGLLGCVRVPIFLLLAAGVSCESCTINRLNGERLCADQLAYFSCYVLRVLLLLPVYSVVC